VQNCLACQTTYAGPEWMEPLNMSEMPGFLRSPPNGRVSARNRRWVF
jgi:hypothetical protein